MLSAFFLLLAVMLAGGYGPPAQHVAAGADQALPVAVSSVSIAASPFDARAPPAGS